MLATVSSGRKTLQNCQNNNTKIYNEHTRKRRNNQSCKIVARQIFYISGLSRILDIFDVERY